MKMDTTIHVFSLNCWGIVLISKNRKERISAIAAHLAASEYDFVFLQEVWSTADFALICSKVESVLPHSFYFHSGAIGSGLGILSKSAIRDTHLHRYSVNGYAHKINHGDWFCGKAVGLCTTFHKGLNINLYVTHMHAEYCNENDLYLGHRIVQAFEVGQFVKLTSQNCDLTIISGDFNTRPEDVAYNLVRQNAELCDAFLDQEKPPVDGEAEEGTCCHPRNLYTCSREHKIWPNGQRIDYIFYRSNKGTNVQCSTCRTLVPTIPESDTIPYSDHQPVVATLRVSKSADAAGTPKCEEGSLACCVEEAQCILSQSLANNYSSKFLFTITSVLLLSLLVVTLPLDLPWPYSVFFALLRILLAVALAFFTWMALVVNRTEEKALRGTLCGLTLLHGRLEGTGGGSSQ